MLDIVSLNKRYGAIRAANDISFRVDKGALFGFLGPNGAGKTTTIKLLTGLARPDSGTAMLDGVNMFRDSAAARRKTGVVHQHTNLDNDLTVWENLDIHCRFYGMAAGYRRRRITEVLEFAELNDRLHTQVKKLSGGLKRRLMICRAILHEPSLLFLDEPTVGLDPAIRRRVWSLIKSVQARGATLFLTTHYIEEAEFLCDRVAFINHGRILSIETPETCKAALGQWAVDILEDRELKSLYFQDRREAETFVVSRPEPVTIRRISLEDVFLTVTGHKIARNGSLINSNGQAPPAAAPDGGHGGGRHS